MSISTIENDSTAESKSGSSVSEKTNSDEGNAGIEERYNKVSCLRH